MPFCTSCGQANSVGSRFCNNCGTALRSSDATSTLSLPGVGVEADLEVGGLTVADRAAVEALPAGAAMLVVRRGPNSGSRFLLDGPVTTAGRHPDSDIFLDDITVSRRHAEFLREEPSRPAGPGSAGMDRAATTYSVRDVGSLNGTYVNRERIESARLTGGDEVQVGKYRLVFFSGVTGAAGTGRPPAPLRQPTGSGLRGGAP